MVSPLCLKAWNVGSNFSVHGKSPWGLVKAQAGRLPPTQLLVDADLRATLLISTDLELLVWDSVSTQPTFWDAW